MILSRMHGPFQELFFGPTFLDQFLVPQGCIELPGTGSSVAENR